MADATRMAHERLDADREADRREKYGDEPVEAAEALAKAREVATALAK